MIERASRGVWEFVVGEDWRLALGVALMLGLTAAVAAIGLPAWWLGPGATVGILAQSVRRGTRRRG